LIPEIVSGYFTVGWQQIVLLNVLCVAVASGALSPLIVSNRMGFFSDAIAHSTLAGVALGLLLGINPVTSMIGAGVVVALLIAAMRQRSGLSVDALLGVALAGSLAIGVILYHFARGFADMHAYLFGRLTFLDASDLIALGGAAVLSMLVVALYSNQFALLAVSRPLAKSRGVKAARYDFILIVLLGLVVSVCVRAVGLLLVNALMVIPAATSKNFARSYRGMCWGALGVSVLASVGGLFAGSSFSIPEGPAIVVLGVAIFLVSYVWRMATHGMGEA
jgi:zinc transport system permease protein